MSMIVFHWINFIILVGALIFFGKKKLESIFRLQRDKLKLEIEATNAKYLQVKAEFASVEKMVAETDAALENVRRESLKEFEQESVRIREEGRQALDRLTYDSELRLRGSKDKALASLQNELFDLALSKATEVLKSDKKDCGREWLNQLTESERKIVGGKKNYAS